MTPPLHTPQPRSAGGMGQSGTLFLLAPSITSKSPATNPGPTSASQLVSMVALTWPLTDSGDGVPHLLAGAQAVEGERLERLHDALEQHAALLVHHPHLGVVRCTGVAQGEAGHVTFAYAALGAGRRHGTEGTPIPAAAGDDGEVAAHQVRPDEFVAVGPDGGAQHAIELDQGARADLVAGARAGESEAGPRRHHAVEEDGARLLLGHHLDVLRWTLQATSLGAAALGVGVLCRT